MSEKKTIGQVADIIDAIYNMTPDMLEKGAKYEVR